MDAPRGDGKANDAPAAAPEAGLCATCAHARVQRSGRGSAFWRCGRADGDRGLPRYPRLPVAACPAHEAGRPQGG